MNELRLLPEAAAMLEKSAEERILYIKDDRWIGYQRARDVLDKMTALLYHPRILRMPNMLIIARTNNGKTQILQRFRELHPACDNEGAEAISVPVVYVQAPSDPDEKRLYADILDAIFARYTISDHAHKLMNNVKDKFTKIGVKVLLIDEINNLIGGSMAKQRKFLIVLKQLSNELRLPIIAAGTEDAVRAIQTDAQLANRFEPVILPRWALDKDFQRLLATYEQMLPLCQPSGLSKKAMAHEIWSRSEGTIGEVIMLIKKAAEMAIREGTELIDVDILDSCDYSAPSARKKRLLEV
jgi:hypothetical protein